MGETARAACLAKRDPDPAGTLLALLREAAGAAKAEMLKAESGNCEKRWKNKSGNKATKLQMTENGERRKKL
jgi:hypothetical protein